MKLAHQCRTWGALPEPGGLLDQPAGLIDKMAVLMNVFNAHKDLYAADNWTEWMMHNPKGAEIINWVKDMKHG